MRNFSDPDFRRPFLVDGDHRDCTFTLVNTCPDPGDADAPAAVTPPDHAPPQSLAEAWAHCRATLERLAAGECFVPDAAAAVEGVAQAVRAACRQAAALQFRDIALTSCEQAVIDDIAAAIDALPLEPPA